MSKLPRRLPVPEEERLKILLSRAGSSVAGQTRFQRGVSPSPTVTSDYGNKVYVQDEEPDNAAFGDLWVTEGPGSNPGPYSPPSTTTKVKLVDGTWKIIAYYEDWS